MTAAIVPAYNEERTVGRVVQALKAASLVDEVVVVSDGSTDGTAEAAEAAGADHVLRLPTNLGKGEALTRGVAATRAETLLFCDADFIGFMPAHADALLRPVLDGQYAMLTGLRDRWPLTSLLAHLPLISGERALRRQVFEGVPARFRTGFRVELAMNYFCRANGLRYGSLPTIGVRFVRKMQKVGVLRGFAGYVRMIGEFADAIVRVRLAKKDFLLAHAS